MAHTRREFLFGSGCLALSGAAFASTFNKLSLINLLAQANSVNDANYKALVCIFMFGGNDSNNIVIPYDNYADYSAVRSAAAFNIPQADLLQISAPSQGANFGLANRRPQYDLTGLFDLYQNNKLAIVCNMGNLVVPLTRADYLGRTLPIPSQLFSHSDQQTQNQTAVSSGSSQTGWGGRLADKIHSTELFPIQTSVAGVTVFTAAQAERPLVLPPTGPLNQGLRVDAPAGVAAVVQNILALDDGTTLRRTSANFASQAFATRDQLSTDPVVGTFPATNLGNQLKQIAKMITLRDTISAGQPMRRQIFFASLGGFDTHTNQLAGQGGLMTQVSNAVSAFYAEMVSQGIGNQVTTFTLSDFTRTFKIGNGATGTDHAWGANHFVVGDAVNGGNFWGTYPTLAINGPDDADSGGNARGRWIPTIGTNQYGSTLAKWFGVADADMSQVFPNIGDFPTADIGFMNNG